MAHKKNKTKQTKYNNTMSQNRIVVPKFDRELPSLSTQGIIIESFRKVTKKICIVKLKQGLSGGTFCCKFNDFLKLEGKKITIFLTGKCTFGISTTKDGPLFAGSPFF